MKLTSHGEFHLTFKTVCRKSKTIMVLVEAWVGTKRQPPSEVEKKPPSLFVLLPLSKNSGYCDQG